MLLWVVPADEYFPFDNTSVFAAAIKKDPVEHSIPQEIPLQTCFFKKCVALLHASVGGCIVTSKVASGMEQKYCRIAGNIRSVLNTCILCEDT